MSNTEAPQGILCTESHEYVLKEDGTAKIGITDYAVHQLGDVVFVELPEVGTTYAKGEVFGTIESVKAASELYMPVGGKISAINEELADAPELVNDDCYGKGWLIKISDVNADDLSSLMTFDQYTKSIES